MTATVALFVFRVDFLLQECEVLLPSLSTFEITRWCVSMTSTISASDLLRSFASLIFTVFVDTVGAHLDLKLMNVVQHCRNLVALLVPNCFRSAGLLPLRCSASASISIAFLISGCFVHNPDNSLKESTLLSESLFHLHASDFGSHRFLCKL